MKKYTLLKFTLFTLFVQSMFIWVTWSIPIGLLHIAVIIVLYKFYSENRLNFVIRQKGIVALLALVMMYQCLRQGAEISTWGSNILLIVIFAIVMGFPKNVYNDTLVFITKWMAIILMPSLLIHFIVMVTGFPSPLVLSQYSDSYGLFHNYIFYIHMISEPVSRFNGPFLEPGHLGMITSFLLFANNFNLRNKYVAFIFACNLLTFSLAAYVLTFSGWLLLYALEKKRLVTVMAVMGLLMIGVSYLPKDSLLNELIFTRLEVVDGSLAGDNRITEDGNFYYQKMIHSDDVFWGYGNNIRDGRIKGAGFKIYVLRNGLFGVVIWGLIFLLLAKNSSKKGYAFVFFVVCCISLYQRFYPYWFSWFFTYYAAINNYQLKPHSINNKKKNISVPLKLGRVKY